MFLRCDQSNTVKLEPQWSKARYSGILRIRRRESAIEEFDTEDARKMSVPPEYGKGYYFRLVEREASNSSLRSCFAVRMFFTRFRR